MKKVISILLICMILSVSCLLVACDSETTPLLPKDTEPTDTTVPENTNTNNDSDKTPDSTPTPPPTGPVPVDSVNGMTARQLLEKLATDFSETSLFDISMISIDIEDGETSTSQIDMKTNESAIYVRMFVDDEDMKVWCMEDVIYVNVNGEKYKASNTSVDDILGEGTLDGLYSELLNDLPEEYLKKADEAQLYCDDSTYYFSITLTDAEAEQMGLGEKGYTETVYVDASGNVKKIVDEIEDSHFTIWMNSYGTPVVITAPADADSYIESSGAGDEDPQVYSVYEQLCETLNGATIYSMEQYFDDTPYLFYETDGEGQYIGSYDEGSTYEIWGVGGKGYVRLNGQNAIETTLTQKLLDTLESGANIAASLADPIPGRNMSNLTLTDGSANQKIISFTVDYGDDIMDYYAITFNEAMTSIHFRIVSTVDGEPDMTSDYYFDYINHANFTVEAPLA